MYVNYKLNTLKNLVSNSNIYETETEIFEHPKVILFQKPTIWTVCIFNHSVTEQIKVIFPKSKGEYFGGLISALTLHQISDILYIIK